MTRFILVLSLFLLVLSLVAPAIAKRHVDAIESDMDLPPTQAKMGGNIKLNGKAGKQTVKSEAELVAENLQKFESGIQVFPELQVDQVAAVEKKQMLMDAHQISVEAGKLTKTVKKGQAELLQLTKAKQKLLMDVMNGKRTEVNTQLKGSSMLLRFRQKSNELVGEAEQEAKLAEQEVRAARSQLLHHIKEYWNQKKKDELAFSLKVMVAKNEFTNAQKNWETVAKKGEKMPSAYQTHSVFANKLKKILQLM